MLRRYSIAALAVAGLLACLSFHRPPETGSVQLRFVHHAGAQLLRLDSGHYANALGQDFTVTKFKYYLSNICLKSRSGKQFFSGGSFLIDEEDTARKRLWLKNVPCGSYETLEFTIGVDSLHNCSGAQAGDLDPLHAMFWAWNTGYIFMKLEGASPAAK